MNNPFETIDARLSNIENLLLDIKHKPKAPEALSDKIYIGEVCEITGRRLSWIYKHSMLGTIPCQKFGKQLIFSRKEIEAWLNSQTVRKQTTAQKETKHLQSEAHKHLK